MRRQFAACRPANEPTSSSGARRPDTARARVLNLEDANCFRMRDSSRVIKEDGNGKRSRDGTATHRRHQRFTAQPCGFAGPVRRRLERTNAQRWYYVNGMPATPAHAQLLAAYGFPLGYYWLRANGDYGMVGSPVVWGNLYANSGNGGGGLSWGYWNRAGRSERNDRLRTLNRTVDCRGRPCSAAPSASFDRRPAPDEACATYTRRVRRLSRTNDGLMLKSGFERRSHLRRDGYGIRYRTRDRRSSHRQLAGIGSIQSRRDARVDRIPRIDAPSPLLSAQCSATIP